MTSIPEKKVENNSPMSYLSEVFVSRSKKGPRKSVLLSRRPSYPGDYLHKSEVFLPEKGKEVQGPEKKCITWWVS